MVEVVEAVVVLVGVIVVAEMLVKPICSRSQPLPSPRHPKSVCAPTRSSGLVHVATLLFARLDAILSMDPV